jgi:hypothetical protein
LCGERSYGVQVSILASLRPIIHELRPGIDCALQELFPAEQSVVGQWLTRYYRFAGRHPIGAKTGNNESG